MRAWGPVTNPTACALASELCALWGRHEGAPERAPPAWVWGVRGRALSHPRPPVRWGVRPGPTTHWLWVRGCGRGDPSPTPPRALFCAGFAPCGGRTRAPGGGASCLGVRRPGSGALPPPTTRPFGRAAGAHYPLPVDAGVGTRRQPHSARSCVLTWRAVGAGPGRPGGGASPLGAGRPGLGALPSPTTRPFGRAAGVHYPLAVGAGGRGREDPSPTPQGALLRAGFARCGGGMREPGGGLLLPGCRASGVGRSPTPNHSSFWACGRGPLPTGGGCGGRGRGDPSRTPQRTLFRAGFARCGGGMRVPGGGPLAWMWGVQGRALSHPRPLVLSGVRPGPTTQWL